MGVFGGVQLYEDEDGTSNSAFQHPSPEVPTVKLDAYPVEVVPDRWGSDVPNGALEGINQCTVR